MNEPTPLEQALSRLQDGEAHAFDEVFDSLWPVLVRYARAKAGSETDPEEIAQRTLVRLFEDIGSYDSKRPALGWALAIAYWECRTERTRSRRYLARHDDVAVADRSDANSPEDFVQQKEHLRAFHAAWEGLGEAERRVLLGEQSPDDMLISPAAFRKKKQRLIERLRKTVHTILGKEPPV